MAANSRLEKVQGSSAPVRQQGKQRRPPNKMVFRGDVKGYIAKASSGGEIIGYSETYEDAPDNHKSPRVPIPKRPTSRRQNEVNHEGTSDRESSDDEGGGSTFYGTVSGYVGHATGPGNVIAMKSSRLNPIHRKNPVDDSYEGPTSQEESDLAGRRNKVQSSKGNMQPSVLNSVPRAIENQNAPKPQGLLRDEAHDVDALEQEFQKLSPEMKRYIKMKSQTGQDAR